MTVSGALVLTGMIFLIPAIVAVYVAGIANLGGNLARTRTALRFAGALALAANVFYVVGIWMEALS